MKNLKNLKKPMRRNKMKDVLQSVQELKERLERAEAIIEAAKMALNSGRTGKRRGRKPGSKNKVGPVDGKKVRKQKSEKLVEVSNGKEPA
jgi:hypothetical protein